MTTNNAIDTPAISLAAPLTTSGAFASTFTFTGATNVTFPTSGTLATTSGSSPWVQVGSTQTASASSSIDFTGLSNTYIVYKIVVKSVVPGTDTDNFYLRFGTGGTPTYQASNYAYGLYGYAAGGSGLLQDANSGVNQMIINYTGSGLRLGSATNEIYDGVFYIFNPSASAGYHYMQYQAEYAAYDGSNHCFISGGGVWLDATAVTAARFLMSSGTIASGTFSLYGLTG